jgi:hypothetical protein
LSKRRSLRFLLREEHRDKRGNWSGDEVVIHTVANSTNRTKSHDKRQSRMTNSLRAILMQNVKEVE